MAKNRPVVAQRITPEKKAPADKAPEPVAVVDDGRPSSLPDLQPGDDSLGSAIRDRGEQNAAAPAVSSAEEAEPVAKAPVSGIGIVGPAGEQFEGVREQIEAKEDLTDLGFRPPRAEFASQVGVPATQAPAQIDEPVWKTPVEIPFDDSITATIVPESVPADGNVTPEQRATAEDALRNFGVDPTGMSNAEINSALGAAADKMVLGAETDADQSGVPTDAALEVAASVADVGGSFRVNVDGSITLFGQNGEVIETIPAGSDGAGNLAVDENGKLVNKPDEEDPGENPDDDDPEKDDDDDDDDDPKKDPDDDDDPEKDPDDDPEKDPDPEDPDPEEGTPNPDYVDVDPRARQEFLDSPLGQQQRKQEEDAAEQAESGGYTDPPDEGGGGGPGRVIDTGTGTIGLGPVRTPGGGEPIIEEGSIVVTLLDLENLEVLAGGGPAAGPGGPDDVSGLRPVPQDPRSPVQPPAPVGPGIRGDVTADVEDDLASTAGSFGSGARPSAASERVVALDNLDDAAPPATEGKRAGIAETDAATVAPPTASLLDDVQLEADVQVDDLDDDALDTL